MELFLPARQPFDFLSVIHSHGWVQLAPFAFDKETAILTYTDRLSSGRVLEYQISAAPGGVGIQTENITQTEQAEVSERVAWMFGLEMDFSAFYAAARGEPKLAHAERTARGRILRSPTLFEDVLKTILTTNTLWGATKRMNLNLIASFGDPLPGKEERAFPSPVSITASSPDTLKETVRVGYRAPSIHELAVRVASGDLDIEAFKSSPLSTPELRKELLKIKGVGPYAAANLLLILGRSDFIPVDSWALKLVSQEWYNGEPVTPAQVEAHFEQWGAFKGLAYWFWDWKYPGG